MRHAAATENVRATFSSGFASLSTACAAAVKLELFNRRQNRLNMAGYPNFSPYFAHVAIVVDEKGRARDSHIGAAVILFLLPDAIGLANCAVLVRNQLERQVIFAYEFVMLGDAILRYADDHRISVGKALLVLGKFAGFLGASRRVIARVKIEHDVSALQGR